MNRRKFLHVAGLGGAFLSTVGARTGFAENKAPDLQA